MTTLFDPHNGLEGWDPASGISGYWSLYGAQKGKQNCSSGAV